MRSSGRPVFDLRRFHQQVRCVRGGRSWIIPGGFELTLTPYVGGMNLCVFVAWTHRMLLQRVYPWDLWLSLTIEGRRSTVMSFFKRPDSGTSPVGKGGIASIDTELAANCPALACYLGSDTWEDGEVRQRSSLVMFFEDGVYKVCLSDKDTNMSLWASSRSFLGLSEALEARLTEERVDWRKQRPRKK